MVGEVEKEVCKTHPPDIPECAGERQLCSSCGFSCRLSRKFWLLEVMQVSRGRWFSSQMPKKDLM